MFYFILKVGHLFADTEFTSEYFDYNLMFIWEKHGKMSSPYERMDPTFYLQWVKEGLRQSIIHVEFFHGIPVEISNSSNSGLHNSS